MDGKSNAGTSILYQFLWTYWPKQWASIDKFAYLSKVSIGIDMQHPTYCHSIGMMFNKLSYCPGCGLATTAAVNNMFLKIQNDISTR